MKNLFIILLVTVANSLAAQVRNQGHIVYEEVLKMQFEMSEEQKAKLKQMNFELPKSFTFEKELFFSSTEALYKNVEKEETPDAPRQGGLSRMMRRGFAQDDILYQNLANGEVLEQKEFMTRKFLIEGEDDEKKLKWTMTGERKEILGFQCQKATAKIKADTTEKEPKDKSKRDIVESEVEAWFTMQIPVSIGPGKYKGLPGVILEMTSDYKGKRGSGTRTITAKKIELRELNKEELSRPDKGKKVTRKQYRKIVKQKMEEMRENRSSGRGGQIIIGR